LQRLRFDKHPNMGCLGYLYWTNIAT